MDEQTLITRCLAGNARAQQILFDKYAPQMMAICMRYMKDEDQAKDVLQDGFIKIFHHLHKYQTTGTLVSWMRKIMVNTALDQLRKNTPFAHMIDIEDVEHKIKSSQMPSHELLANDLIQLIQKLPEGHRTVFNLFAIEGYSHKEIAEMLQINENTSKSHYFRARAVLKTEIERLSKD